jgi:hypothetical protein
MKEELEKELLKAQEKQKKTDRDEYLEEIKKSIGIKRKDEELITQSALDKLKPAESLLGDTTLYSEIASELSKLGGGKDLAGMFEQLIVKMAEAKIEQTDEQTDEQTEEVLEETELVQEQKPDPEPQDDQNLIEEALVLLPEMETLEESDTPIDVLKAAFDHEDISEESNEFDWDDYGKRLDKKYNDDD